MPGALPSRKQEKEPDIICAPEIRLPGLEAAAQLGPQQLFGHLLSKQKGDIERVESLVF